MANRGSNYAGVIALTAEILIADFGVALGGRFSLFSFGVVDTEGSLLALEGLGFVLTDRLKEEVGAEGNNGRLPFRPF